MTTLTACRMIAPERHSRYDHVTKVTTIAGHNYYSANAKTTATMDKRHLQRHRSPNHTTTLCVWRYHTACMCTSSEAIRMLNADFIRITKHAMALLYQTQLLVYGTSVTKHNYLAPPRYLCMAHAQLTNIRRYVCGMQTKRCNTCMENQQLP